MYDYLTFFASILLIFSTAVSIDLHFQGTPDETFFNRIIFLVLAIIFPLPIGQFALILGSYYFTEKSIHSSILKTVFLACALITLVMPLLR